MGCCAQGRGSGNSDIVYLDNLLLLSHLEMVTFTSLITKLSKWKAIFSQYKIIICHAAYISLLFIMSIQWNMSSNIFYWLIMIFKSDEISVLLGVILSLAQYQHSWMCNINIMSQNKVFYTVYCSICSPQIYVSQRRCARGGNFVFGFINIIK